MVRKEDAILVVVDVQGKLALSMHEQEKLFSRLAVLIRGALLFEVPIIVTEQVPAKLGPTVGTLRELVPHIKPIEKHTFSCLGCPEFAAVINSQPRRTILLAGIESHVCVYQTAVDLLRLGYNVEVIADAVSSRSPENRTLALDKMRSAGAQISGVEMILFELQVTADDERFRDLVRLVK